jgi:hypothetical protein
MRPALRVPAFAALLLAGATAAGPVAATSEPTPPTPATTENPFFPDDASVDLSDCISALPPPGCGSDERGGWRQAAVFAVVIAGIGAMSARLVIGIRRRDRQTDGDDT